ncbi:hypothetical protein BVRB_5g111300 [Beta vulgaris subsp. vulgaris]|nr:hypothetical protein BVRB_5g111300 [Beta vulgaris subsp. vulgaris]
MIFWKMYSSLEDVQQLQLLEIFYAQSFGNRLLDMMH